MDFDLTTGPEIFLFALGFRLISLLSNGHRTVLRREKLLEISHTAQFLNACLRILRRGYPD